MKTTGMDPNLKAFLWFCGIVLVGCLLAVFTGCGEARQLAGVPTTAPPEAPPVPIPDPVTVTLSGQCNGGMAQVRCRDNSSSIPVESIASISFELVDVATGFVAGFKHASPGLDPPRQVNFTGVPPGDYIVNHAVFPNDGGEPATTTYSVTVTV